jgi:hypothetical protein
MRRLECVAVCAVLTFVLAACKGGGSTTDAAVTDDAASDAAPRCTTSAECDDHDVCNGAETCTAGACVAGAALACGDGIACTVDACDPDDGCTHVADADGDGHAALDCLDGTGAPFGDDCDDADANRFPGNVEVCDANDHDEDCDSDTFGVVDRDTDGFADARCCNPTVGGGATCGTDCDDARTSVRPGQTEACNTLDDDCDGETDEGVAIARYPDADFDGHGAIGATAEFVCAGVGGFAPVADDCDDTNPARHPGQVEICDGLDNDCSGTADPADSTQAITWYEDADGDGFGRADVTLVACVPPVGHSILSSDCDDTAASINPGASEVCDGIDQNCNGVADFRLGTNDFEDDDDDGLVDVRCTPVGTDCDDTDADVGPGGAETCDGRDNDCDQDVDEDVSTVQWFRDVDDDGYGAESSGAVIACQPIAGFVAAGGDCDDGTPARRPSAAELCNGDDDDCDGAVDETPASAACTATNATAAACRDGACAPTACVTNFADCNGIATDGCETFTNTTTDCGGCGVTCPSLPNGMVSCDSGQCTITMCPLAFADCNGSRADGCESSQFTDPLNCGGCGNVCAFPQAVATCAAGFCRILECASNRADCDGIEANGCEVDLLTDVTACGECGRACVGTNTSGAPSCAAGTCVRGPCIAGAEDCDGDPANGCEASLLSDARNCDACNVQCPNLPHATASCVAGSCGLSVCNGGYDDCDGMSFNGCEVHLATDQNHCGACNAPCDFGMGGYGTCQSGMCVPTGCRTGFGDCSLPGTCDTDLRNDPSHCGACGNPCIAPNGTPTCRDTVCGVANCMPGFGDCIASPSDGCETVIADNPNHCGQCGRSCGAGGACNTGQCDTMTKVVTGANHTCVLRANGGVACWGGNESGQLGIGTLTTSEPMPTTVSIEAIDIAAGDRFTCAIGTNGTVYCWGIGQNGRNGASAFPGSVETPTPIDLQPWIGTASRITAGHDHACVLTDAGEVYCWGNNATGQLGDGGALPGPTTNVIPLEVAGLPVGAPFDLQAGNGFTCANISGFGVYCWGRNDQSQLGRVSADTAVPGAVSVGPGMSAVNALAVGAAHACIVTGGTTPRIACWGQNDVKQTGRPAGATVATPEFVAGIVNPVTVYAAAAHTCARVSTGSVLCWGMNAGRRLATQNMADPLVSPSSVSGLGGVGVLTIGSAASHTCVLASSGRNASCWGVSSSGQVGANAMANPATQAVTVPGLGN